MIRNRRAQAANPDLIDLTRLVNPVSGDNPCGVWLRYDPIYDHIREARREDNAALPQGVWQSEPKRADWAQVETLCAEALATKSKDLYLAAWLLEAWIQLDGFAGAARGLELLHGLSSAYWDGIFPALESKSDPALGPDLTARLAPFQWIDDKLPRRLRLVSLTQPAMENLSAYSLADWNIAVRNPGEGQSDTAVSLGKFKQSADLSPYEWFASLDIDVQATLANAGSLNMLLDEKAGKLAPGLMKFRAEASAAQQLVEDMLSAARPKLPPPPIESALQPGYAELAINPHASLLESGESELGGPVERRTLAEPRIRTRDDAYRLLEEIAEYLYETDPHSPTPYLIRRAVAWRDMHFAELLPEFIRDHADLSEIVKLLRLDGPESR